MHVCILICICSLRECFLLTWTLLLYVLFIGFPGLCAALLAEAERLGQECVEVQMQAEKDCSGLASRLQMLEQALEEQESRAHQLEEQHRLQTEDLQQHIDALEKQLKHNRQFIDVSDSNSLFCCLKFFAPKLFTPCLVLREI